MPNNQNPTEKTKTNTADFKGASEALFKKALDKLEKNESILKTAAENKEDKTNRDNIKIAIPPTTFFPKTNHDADYYGQVFESFFYNQKEITGVSALSAFIEKRATLTKCKSSPTILFTAIQAEDREMCLVSISGIAQTPASDNATSPDPIKENINQFCANMTDFFNTLSKKTGLNYIFVGKYDANYYELIRSIAYKINSTESWPDTDEKRQCAERMNFFFLQQLINLCGDTLKIEGSQAFKLSPERPFNPIPPCDICKKHIKPVSLLFETTKTLSLKNSANTSRSTSPIKLSEDASIKIPKTNYSVLNKTISDTDIMADFTIPKI